VCSQAATQANSPIAVKENAMMKWDAVEIEAKPDLSMRVRFADGTNGLG